jgi:hypothetical protein
MTGVRSCRLIARSLAAALGIVASIASGAAPVRGADHTVAVALFYAPTPVTTYTGVVPEDYVAADLSTLLAASSAGRLTVVPRDRVKAAEYALRWRTDDALRFGRLQQLAAAVGADRVVVGWIRQLTVEGNGGGGGPDFDLGGGAGGLITGLAVVEYQVFDAAQGRIVYETESEGHAVGGVSLPRAAQATLDDVDRRGAAQLIGPLTAGTATP